jgi:hypothetical protein
MFNMNGGANLGQKTGSRMYFIINRIDIVSLELQVSGFEFRVLDER